jgi:hypothetical protein
MGSTITIMRRFRLAATLIFGSVIAFLLDTPVEVAKDLYIHPIAEYIREKTGLNVSLLETALWYSSFTLPFLAAFAVLYLYHLWYVMPQLREIERKSSLVSPVEERRQSVAMPIVSSAFLVAFIVGMIYIGYNDRFAATVPEAYPVDSGRWLARFVVPWCPEPAIGPCRGGEWSLALLTFRPSLTAIATPVAPNLEAT